MPEEGCTPRLYRCRLEMSPLAGSCQAAAPCAENYAHGRNTASCQTTLLQTTTLKLSRLILPSFYQNIRAQNRGK